MEKNRKEVTCQIVFTSRAPGHQIVEALIKSTSGPADWPSQTPVPLLFSLSCDLFLRYTKNLSNPLKSFFYIFAT